MKKVVLRVFGMTCNDCVSRVRAGLLEREGVLDASVSLKDGTAVVQIDEGVVRPDDLELLPVFKGGRYRAQVRSVE